MLWTVGDRDRDRDDGLGVWRLEDGWGEGDLESMTVGTDDG